MKQKIDKIFFIIGLIMLASEVWKQYCLTFIVNGGVYDWWYFPFQLCSIPMYVLLCLAPVHSNKIRSIIYTFLMNYSLLCGIFVFFNTDGMIYSYLPLTIHSFLWHFLLIGLGIAAGISGKADYSTGGFLKSCLIYVCGCLAATGLNIACHSFGIINMFYISPYYTMNQPVFSLVARRLGNTAGILGYIAAIITGSFLLHKCWDFIQKKSTASS